MAEKKKIVRRTTPKGYALWPYLTKPDDRPIKGKPQKAAFKVNLAYAKDDLDWLKLKELLDGLVEEAYEKAVEENPKKKKLIVRQFPYSDELDEEGEETGRVIVKFKQSAQIKKKNGEVINVTIPLFDAKGTPMKAGTQVYSGSIVKVAFTTRPYLVDSTNCAGVSLDLNAVQVLKLVSSTTRDASAYGFGQEEGYEADEEEDTDNHGFEDENVGEGGGEEASGEEDF